MHTFPIKITRLTAVLMLVVSATALGQVANDLFSPPSVAKSAINSNAPLPLTNALVPNSSIFGAAPAPQVDLSGDATGQVVAGTPALLSTPDAVEASPAIISPITTPVAPTPNVVDWGSTKGYKNAASLWGGDSGYPAVEQPAATYAPETVVMPTVEGFAGCEQPCDGGSAEFEFTETAFVEGDCGQGCGAPCFRGCGKGNCGSLCGCGPATWARFDLLLWNIDGYSTPALITSAPGDTVQNNSGALGGEGTRVLYGNQQLGDDLRIGGRFQFGKWFDNCRRFGIQTDFFGLGGGNQSRTFTGDGENIYARPFFNTDPNVNAQDAQVFAMPGLAEGSVRFDTSSEVWSAGPSLRFNVCCSGNDPCNPSSCSRRVDFLLGYRYFRLEERFASEEILRPTAPGYIDGTLFALNDSIRTRNDFHGLELGVNRLSQRGPWLWDVTALVALGEVERTVDLDGSTRIVVPGFTDDTFPGGFFVGPRDIGRFRDNDFAAIPQVRVNMSYCLGCNWRLSAGYNFMYLSSAFRPGQFLNTEIDGTRLGQNRTVSSVRTPSFRRNDMFLHGANVGLTYNF